VGLLGSGAMSWVHIDEIPVVSQCTLICSVDFTIAILHILYS